MSERKVWTHGICERHGYRWWLHIGRRCLGIEVSWWTHFCHVGAEVDDEGWKLSAAFPPLAIWVSLENFGLWRPTYQTVATWRNPPETITLPQQRQCRLSIYDWTIRFDPWAKSMEWCRADPWWVRGVSFDVKDFALGRTRYTCEKMGEPFDVPIPMPEGTYRAVFQRQRQTWRRPRWFSHTRDSYDIDIPKGIPFAGKGENSWDCGDDGLFGLSAEGSIEQAIEHVRASVMRSRRKYGHASDDAIREALA
jgi:hypothetical protein